MASELVIRAQSGDREAFDALATAAYDRLYSIGRRILRDASAAEDAVQEALIRCWRDLRSLRDPDRFEAWLHRLLVNACYDEARRRRRFSVAVSDIAADRSDPADHYAAVAQRDELERLFVQLPVEHRAAIVLTHNVGLSGPEAAQILGVPPGTVYSRVHHGLRMMRGATSPTSSLNAGFGSQARVVIDLRFGHTVEPWTDGLGRNFDAGIPPSPDGKLLAILTARDGVIVADFDSTSPDYEGALRRLGPVTDCWIDWSPDGTALYGGSPDDCTRVVVIPLAAADMALTLPMSGIASWQPRRP